MGDHKKDSVGEEVSAFGERVKGAAKDAAGSVTGNERLEREGEFERREGDARQEANDVIGGGSGAAATRARASRSVHGLFRDRESADAAYRSLSERGYGKDDINVVMTDETRKKYYPDGDDSEVGSKALEGMGVGAGLGGTLGAVLAGIAAVGTSIVIPGLGLTIAGPIAAALAGAGAGGAVGGLVGTLIGAGIPEEHAKRYEEGVKGGGIYMGVDTRADEDADYIEREWRETHRGENVYR